MVELQEIGRGRVQVKRNSDKKLDNKSSQPSTNKILS